MTRWPRAESMTYRFWDCMKTIFFLLAESGWIWRARTTSSSLLTQVTNRRTTMLVCCILKMGTTQFSCPGLQRLRVTKPRASQKPLKSLKWSPATDHRAAAPRTDLVAFGKSMVQASQSRPGESMQHAFVGFAQTFQHSIQHECE